jgi:2-methylisocitrate lyase-like PEP mutase family enzyme
VTAAAAQLRRLLADPAMLRAPGVFDGISAHVARRAGVEAAQVPVIADADTGYGSPINVVRTVHAYEQAGVAAIQLEDQVFPKRCGHLPGKEVVPVEAFVASLRAALDARRGDTVIIARTDARGPAGLEEALSRAHRYAAEGADVVFVEAPRSREEVERVAAEVEAPLLVNVVPGGATPEIPDDELQRLGFAIAIYPGALLMPAATAMVEVMARMTGTPVEVVDSPADLFGLVGLSSWAELGERYRAGGSPGHESVGSGPR